MTFIQFIVLKLFFRKEIENMAMVYVSLIVKGRKTFSQVPAPIKEQVRQILIDCDLEYLVVEDTAA